VTNMTFAYDAWPINDLNKWHFVWGIDKKLYLMKSDKNNQKKLGHATFFCGRPVLFAGEMGVDAKGTLTWVSDKSGHYRPTLQHMRNFLLWLQDEVHVDITTIEWRRGSDVLLVNEVMDLSSAE